MGISAEKMLELAGFVGVDLDALEAVRRRLEAHEAEYDDAEDWWTSNRAEKRISADIAELAEAYKKLARAVERGGAA